VPKDPNTELLSEIVGEMNTLFEGDLTDGDMLYYALTITDKVMESVTVVHKLLTIPKNKQ